MSEESKENIQNQIKEVKESITQLQLLHETLNDEYEWNIRRDRLILEQYYLSNEDRAFFVERIDSIKKMQEKEDSEFEEMNYSLKRKTIKYEEEMEELQRRDNTEEKD